MLERFKCFNVKFYVSSLVGVIIKVIHITFWTGKHKLDLVNMSHIELQHRILKSPFMV